ncbi:PadR family transcriptional regulator [Streptomyces sp. MMCC 100]|uniref:PadR family transcriptional regulator n=1 Tax=Streptomyces sp. MMCC 100 TaxID=3163555 RepID=UPI003598E7ED
MSTVRLTKPTIAVLEVLLTSTEDSPAWGLSICRDADLGSGTVYPILDRLVQRGWVTSWNEEEAHPGRPPRRYYELSGKGREEVRSALEARRARLGHARRPGFAGGAA